MTDTPTLTAAQIEALAQKLTEFHESDVAVDARESGLREVARYEAASDNWHDAVDDAAPALIAAARTLVAREAQTCATCRNADPSEPDEAVFYCHALKEEVFKLARASGEPFGCNQWQARATAETE